MTISIDTNVIAALWKKEHAMNATAVRVLGDLAPRERLVVSGPVYAELMAGPLRDEASLDHFFEDTGIDVDWEMDEEVWREAGRAYRAYVQRRQASRGGDARRILADFLIGAHAQVRGYTMLTLDTDDFAAAFPKLPMISA
ncbi:MAG: type II toxin-antitoxin system VapC family toxin [Terracidiphilus sp.]|jgi:predicted nucleic acid-binding protein